MRTLGLLGGMSWESTGQYYRWINELTRTRLGGFHSAPIVLLSVDFHAIEKMQQDGDWHAAGLALADAARHIEAGGAEVLLICTNTMHCVAPAVEQAIGIPLLHIADATGEAVKSAGVETVGLLGTRFTMEQDFYRGRLQQRHGLEVLIPGQADRDIVHRVIYKELCLGEVREESRREFLRIIDELAARGARAVILGCTEIAMLVGSEHTTMPLFDTTRIHAEAAVDWALGVT